MNVYGNLAPIYDKLTKDVPYDEFANFYEKIFRGRQKRVKTLLDVGCGTGTLTLIMAKRGYELIGTDASCDMLSIARGKAAQLEEIIPAPIPPLFLCQPMTELDLYGTVDAAISCLDAVNYLPLADTFKFFGRLHLFLEPGGVFIFDINSPERLRSLDGATFVDEDEDSLCLWRADYDSDEKALIYGMDIFKRRGSLWERFFEEHVEYAHELEELQEHLESAGFKNIEIRTDGPQFESGRIFIVAENG